MQKATSQTNPSGNHLADITKLKKLYAEEFSTIKEHELTKAKIASISHRDVMLDLGSKSDPVLPLSEFKDLPDLKVGDEIEVYVAEKENKEGDIVVSRQIAKLIKSWAIIHQAHKDQSILTCHVKRKIKGGLAVDLEGIEAFLPSSQIGTSPTENLEELIGASLQVEILNINTSKNNVIVSRRLPIEREQEEQRKKIITGLQNGQILSGKVKNITHFGAFIDLAGDAGSTGGIVGLVHKNEMSWAKKPPVIEEIKDEKGDPLFVVGNQIRVVVKSFDLESGNIYLSTRLLLPNPWSKFVKEVKEEDIVKGEVKEIMSYGAFVELINYPEVTGLLHVSDISHASYLDHPSEVISAGDQLDLKVLTMDESTHDLRLGLKQLTPNPWDRKEIIEKYKTDTIHDAKVRLIIREGAYLTLEPGIEGFVYNHHLSWTKKIYNAAEVLKKKETIKVKILGMSEEKKLFELGVREVENNPWPTFAETFQAGTTHKGTIHRKVNGGAVVEIPYGILTFVNNKELVKKDKTEIKEGEALDFVILSCSPEKELITLSHVATYQKRSVRAGTHKKTNAPDKLLNFEQDSKESTLGDLGPLSKLREELRKKEETEKSPSKTKK